MHLIWVQVMTTQKSNKRNNKKKSIPNQSSLTAKQQANRRSSDVGVGDASARSGNGSGSTTTAASLKVQNLDLSLGSLTISSPPGNNGRGSIGSGTTKEMKSTKSSNTGRSWEAISPTPSCRYSSVESGGTGNKKTNRMSLMMNAAASPNRSINISDGNTSNCSSITTESGGDSPGKKKHTQSDKSSAIPAYATLKSNKNNNNKKK